MRRLENGGRVAGVYTPDFLAHVGVLGLHVDFVAANRAKRLSRAVDAGRPPAFGFRAGRVTPVRPVVELKGDAYVHRWRRDRPDHHHPAAPLALLTEPGTSFSLRFRRVQPVRSRAAGESRS